MNGNTIAINQIYKDLGTPISSLFPERIHGFLERDGIRVSQPLSDLIDAISSGEANSQSIHTVSNDPALSYRFKKFIDARFNSDQIKTVLKEPLFHIPLDIFSFSVRTKNCLKDLKIKSIGDLVSFSSEGNLLRTPNFGRKCLNEVKASLEPLGLQIGMGPYAITQYCTRLPAGLKDVYEKHLISSFPAASLPVSATGFETNVIDTPQILHGELLREGTVYSGAKADITGLASSFKKHFAATDKSKEPEYAAAITLLPASEGKGHLYVSKAAEDVLDVSAVLTEAQAPSASVSAQRA